MNSIYTAGYAGRTPGQLKRAAADLGAYVVDIRHSNQSRQPGWSGKELQSYLGNNYLWCRALGNANFNSDGDIQIADAPTGMLHLGMWLAQRPLILLCGCNDYESCHRKVVAQMLAQTGATVSELVWPVIEREGAIPSLSLWQPWASLIAIGAKGFETRGWETSYRGPLAIHAAKTTKEFAQCAEEPFWSVLDKAGLVDREQSPDDLEGWQGLSTDELRDCIADLPQTQLAKIFPLPTGKIVAIAQLTDCLPTVPDCLRETSRQEREFGNYQSGRFGWKLENVKRLKEPIEQRGAQKLFSVTLPDNIMRHLPKVANP